MIGYKQNFLSTGLEKASSVFSFLLAALLISAALNMSFQSKAYATESRGLGMRMAEPKKSVDFLKGSYRALIIGNNDYEDPTQHWSSLKTAVSDARAIENILVSQYGFTDVQRLENASRRDILKALQSMSKRIEKDDSILLYYAGHGFLDEDSRKGFWVPVDAEGTDTTTFLRNSTIRDELTTIADRAKHTLLISDSCFSGSLLRPGNRGITKKDSTPNYYKKISQKKSVQIMTAGGVEYVDDDYKQSGHSPFTYFLLNELKHNHEPLLTATELAGSVRKIVANNAEQIPESGVLQGAGDELGEFIFVNVTVNVNGLKQEDVQVVVDVQPKQVKPQRAAQPYEPKSEQKPLLPIPML